MTPKTRPSWKAKFRAWLTKRFGVGLPPILATSPTSTPLKTPFLSQEPVSEANRPAAVAQAQRTRQVMDRICATNNANVTRNYGTHTEDLSYRCPPRALDAQELADAAFLLHLRVADPDHQTAKACVAERAAITTELFGSSSSCDSGSSYSSDSSSCSSSSFD